MDNISANLIKCVDCGLLHPRVNGPCPMAKPKTPDGTKTIDLEKILNNLRIQLKIKIERTKIKDYDSFFIFLSTEINKLVENYKEIDNEQTKS